MKIRKYQKEDKEEIEKLIFDIWKEIYDIAIEDEWEDFGEYPLFYVIEDGEEIVGTTGLEKIDEDTAELKRMYFKKQYRGRGLGNKLLEMVLLFANKNNYKKMILSVYPQNKYAIDFYEKNKFKKIREEFDKDDYKYFVFERDLRARLKRRLDGF